jgi:DNA-directed RNA polymerase specialized sigma24 family protein
LSFEQEVQPHLRTLHHQAYRLTRDVEAANDLVQDALERGYRKIDRLATGVSTAHRTWCRST